MTRPLADSSAAEIKRRCADHLLSHGFHLFDVAVAFGVAPRVLLAWIRFQHDKWENDATLGRGPGPDEQYAGDWPSEAEEFEEYRCQGIKVEDFRDSEHRARFVAYQIATKNLRR